LTTTVNNDIYNIDSDNTVYIDIEPKQGTANNDVTGLFISSRNDANDNSKECITMCQSKIQSKSSRQHGHDAISSYPLTYYVSHPNSSDTDNGHDYHLSNEKFNSCLMSKTKGFNIAHLNVVTLTGKIDEFRHMLKNYHVHVMALSETRLDESIPIDYVDIDDFTIYQNDRNRNGGGVAFLCSSR